VHLLDEASRFSLQMVDDAVRAFAERDASLAIELKERDKKLDAMVREITDKLVLRMQEDPANLETYLNLIMIGRSFERVGDHAANIAEDVVFAVKAQDIRHLGK
jgi:phosphate transport system protein